MRFDVPALIISSLVRTARGTVFDFVVIAERNGKRSIEIRGLPLESRTIELVNENEHRNVRVEIAKIGFRARKMMLQVNTAGKIPAHIGRKIVQVGGLAKNRRLEQSLPGLSRIARGIAYGKMNLICGAEFPSEISRKRGVAEAIVRPLAVCVEIRNRRSVIETADDSAQVRFLTLRLERAALSKERQRRLFCGAAMRENLHHAVHGIGAEERAGCAMNNFDFVDIGKIQIREINVTAGLICRRSINKDFREIGIAAVEEE